MDVSIQHGEVRNFASQMRQWANDMNSVRQNILQRTHQLEMQWNDPQYRLFVETAKNHGNNLGLAISDFERMSQQLLIIAESTEKLQAQTNAGIRSMGR